MAFNQGKVSFSFSKISIKKPSFNVQPKEIVKKVDKIEFIDSIEDNSVKILNADNNEEKSPLVIPLKNPNLLLESVISTVNSRKEDLLKNSETADKTEFINTENGTESASKKETLDEMAARELIEDATKESLKKSKPSSLTVPISNQTSDKQESSLEDYENIPVGDFGLAMLRGMGWNPGKGIGKNGKVVTVTGPTVRPKGLGLGAEKAIGSHKPTGKNVSDKEVLSKGSKIRVTIGQYKNLYGTVEGFNDDGGRVDVFMALTSERVSMNECFIQLVTLEEFSKYSKVININAYNNYKECESGKIETSKEKDVLKPKQNKDKCDEKVSKKDSYDHNKPSSRRGEMKNENSSSDSDRHSRKTSNRSGGQEKKKTEESKHRSSSTESLHFDDKPKKSVKHSSNNDEKYSSKTYKYDSKESKSSKYKSKSSKYDSKSSKSRSHKKYSSDSDSSTDRKYRSKHRSKGHTKDSQRRHSSSSESDYDRRRKSKSSKKDKHRSRSRHN